LVNGSDPAVHNHSGDLDTVCPVRKRYRVSGFSFTACIQRWFQDGAPWSLAWGELFAVQPFANDLVKMDLTGAQVWTLLGQQFQTPSNRILEISGLHYRYHLTSPTTGVIDAVFVGPPGDDSTRVPNDASVTYTVTINSFLAGGGGGFTVLRDGTNRVVGPVDLDALVEYVGALPTPFTSEIEGRIVLTT
jgi:5'-nucleotidase